MACLLAAAPAFAQSVTLSKPRATVNPALCIHNVQKPADTDMKKAPAFAGENATSITLGYCGDVSNAYGLGEATTGTCALAVGFPSAYLAESGFVGNKITAINVVSPIDGQRSSAGRYVNSLTNCKVYITETLGGTPICETTGTLSKTGFNSNKIALTTPYDITSGKDVYVCVEWENVTENDYFMTVDAYSAVNDNTFYLYSKFGGVTQQGNAIVNTTASWSNMVPYLPYNLALSAEVEGDNLPTDMASIFDDDHAPVARPGQPFEYLIGFTNKGSNPIKDVDIEMTFTGQQPQTVHASVTDLKGAAAEIAYGENGMAAATFTCPVEGLDVPYTVTISKINGQPNKMNSTLSGTVTCLEQGYTQKVVVEELTSSTCSACPIGIVGMEAAKEAFPDIFIPVAVHCPIPRVGDKFNVCNSGGTYYGFYTDAYYGTGGQLSAPGAIVNRDFSTLVYPSASELTSILNQYKGAETIAEVVADVKQNETTGKFDLNVTVNTCMDDANNYGISYTLLEDDLGPQNQANGFAGSSTPCGGWEKKSQNVPTMYNDVVRPGSVYTPASESYINGLKKGESYTYSTTMDTSSLNDVQKSSVVVMLVNRTSKKVLNATVFPLKDAVGIDSVEAEQNNAPVAQGMAGAINMLSKGNVFTMDGRMVAADAQGVISLPAGLYIVATPAGNAKIMVR